MQPAAKYFHVLLLVSEYFAQQSISLPRVPKIKIQQNFEIKFEKHWKTNGTMWKYCYRLNFIWMVTPYVEFHWQDQKLELNYMYMSP